MGDLRAVRLILCRANVTVSTLSTVSPLKPLFDTHCHLDAHEFDPDRQAVIDQAQLAGVSGILIPAVCVANFETVRDLAHALPNGAYAVGIHPLFVESAQESDLLALSEFLQAHSDDPRLVAVGEIGLDFFVQEIRTGAPRERQITFYRAQLDLAARFGLPVLLHVRRSQDELLKWLRRSPKIGGIAHAFNGSLQQAKQFIELGFALGMGGAMTYTRALQIRRLAVGLPLHDLVLETDSPDIAPAWLGGGSRNTPAEVAGVASALAALGGYALDDVIEQTAHTARRVVPKLATLWP